MPNHVLGDRVLVTSTTTGTGTYQLGSAVAGFLDFAQAGIASGSRVTAVIQDSLTSPTAFEVIEGVYTSGAPSTLTRANVRRSTGGAVSAVNWAAGTRYISLTMIALRTPVRDSDGHLPMAGTRLTGLGLGLLTDDAARLDQVAWRLISETVVSVATGSVVFTAPTGAKRMKVEFADVLPAVAGFMFGRASTDNAVSYLTGGTDYSRVIAFSGGAGGTVQFSQGGAGSTMDLTAALSTTANAFGDIEVQTGAGAYRGFKGHTAHFDSSGNLREAVVGGFVTGGAGAAVTHLLLAINGGNITSGRFRLLGAF